MFPYAPERLNVATTRQQELRNEAASHTLARSVRHPQATRMAVPRRRFSIQLRHDSI